MIVLDTNVISELVRQAPDPVVVAYLRRLEPDVVFTAAICEAEIHFGLARMPPGQRRTKLSALIESLFTSGFRGRILSFDSICAKYYGEIRAERDATGRPIGVEDAMIAATVRAYGASLATRNVADFVDCGTTIVNPWIAD